MRAGILIEAVPRVARQGDRDGQPFGCRQLLQLINPGGDRFGIGGADQVEVRHVFVQHLARAGTHAHEASIRVEFAIGRDHHHRLEHHAGFLFDGHPLEQVVDALVDGWLASW